MGVRTRAVLMPLSANSIISVISGKVSINSFLPVMGFIFMLICITGILVGWQPL